MLSINKNKLKNLMVNKYFIILSFLILTILSSFILVSAGTLHGEDMVFNLKRIIELKYDLIHYHFLLPFAINTDHGAAVLGSYPSFNLLPIIFFNLLGLNLKASILFNFSVNIFIALIISFISSLKISKSILTSYLFSVLYATSYVFIVDNFMSMDLGVASTYVFLPLVIFGFINLMDESHYLELSTGMSLIVLSNLPSVAIVTFFLLIWLLCNIKCFNINIFKSFFKSAILIICLTSLFLVPFIILMLNNRIVTPTSSQISCITIKSLLLHMSIVAIIAIFIVPFYFIRMNKHYKQMYILSLIIIIFSSKLIPYHLITSIKLFKFINKFQFTYRFLIIPQLLLIFLFSSLISNILRRHLKTLCNVSRALLLILSIIIVINVSFQILVIHKYNQVTAVSKNTTKPLVNGHGLKVTNNKNMKYLINIPNLSNDYFPQESNNYSTYINNGQGTYIKNGQSKDVYVKDKGFNRYYVYNHNKLINNIHLPMIKYRGENISLFMNKHKINYYVDNYNRLVIHTKKDPINKIQIYVKPNHIQIDLIIEYVLFIIGILLCTWECIKNNINLKDGNKK